MAFADTADRRVARHLAGIIRPEREQSDARAAARCGGRSFAPGMPGADHQYVKHIRALAQ